MGRGISSKLIIRTGELSCITCPCGWEVSIAMKDENRCRKMTDLKMKLHKKKCDRVNSFQTTEDWEIRCSYVENRERNKQFHKSDSFRKNLENIENGAVMRNNQ